MATYQNTLSQKFLQLMESNAGIIYKVAKTYCWDEEDQKDLIQEISIQAWRSFPKFDSQFKFSTWLYKVALNVSISHLRKEKSRKSNIEELGSQYQGNSEDVSQEEEQVKALYDAIAEQSPINKGIMLLYLEAKSYAEIAEIMGLSQTNVATKLSRVKEEIRQKLNPSKR